MSLPSDWPEGGSPLGLGAQSSCLCFLIVRGLWDFIHALQVLVVSNSPKTPGFPVPLPPKYLDDMLFFLFRVVWGVSLGWALWRQGVLEKPLALPAYWSLAFPVLVEGGTSWLNVPGLCLLLAPWLVFSFDNALLSHPSALHFWGKMLAPRFCSIRL